MTERQRVGVLLQAAALLSHLEQAGWHLPAGWDGVRLTPDGRLCGAAARPGRGGPETRELLRSLLVALFGAADELPGRGEARRVARQLAAACRPALDPLSPDRVVAQLLDAGLFLWEPAFAEVRRSLAGEVPGSDGPQLWAAGPGPFRARLLGRAGDRSELAALLGSPDAHALWQDGHRSDPTMSTLPRAEALFAHGQFRDVLVLLAGETATEAVILRLRCLVQLGELGAAERALRRLAVAPLDPAQRLAAAEVAAPLLANRGAPGRARAWVRRARAAAGAAGANRALAARADLLAAGAAWDSGDFEAMRDHLEAARGGLDDRRLAWRWYQLEGLRATGAGEDACASFARALDGSRRVLASHEAAGLWNDLGLGRARGGDLAGAERAFRHSARLFGRCHGPRRATLALPNLAEIRLRRGHLAGVREVLEESTAANRLAGNLRGLVMDTGLWARYELALGRPAAALALCRDALGRLDRHGESWHRAELHALAARALGWLGRPQEAATELARTTPEASADLEPEERPALWAHAGDRETALATAAGTPWAEHWLAALTGVGADLSAAAATTLGPYRAARLAFDLELAAPGAVAAPWRRTAIATLRACGADALAERLEARDEGPWRALAAYFGKPAGSLEALDRLWADAGSSDAELSWEGEDGWRRIAGTGGDDSREVLAADLPGGRLVLRAPQLDAQLQALFALALRDLPPAGTLAPLLRAAPAAPPSGLLGDSPLLHAAVDRLTRLAPGAFPVLVLGESGTGKELAARWVHRASQRSAGPFVAVNCAALSETLLLSDLFGHVRGAFTGADRDRAGVFEAGQGGTVFLDEIGDLPAVAQGTLLRLLQEGEVRRVGESLPRRVDVRVVAATHRDLPRLVDTGSFRQDLYFRLQVGRVELPPLRERGRDVLRLAEHFLARRGGRLTAAAGARLLAHRWPGNVRELQNVLAVAATLAGTGAIAPEHLDLPEARGAGGRGEHGDPGRTDGGAASYHRAVDAHRRRLLTDALADCGGNRAEAARRLGLSRQALSYLARRLGLP